MAPWRKSPASACRICTSAALNCSIDIAMPYAAIGWHCFIMTDSVIVVTMPRSRDPARLDQIVAAATQAFTTSGFDRAKISQIAERARIGPGTVYLYVEDKESLFELALLRALESPLAANPALPYRKSPAGARARLIEDCLHEVAHFPQLWVANQRRNVTESVAEFDGILLEMAQWLRRYRSAVALAERNRTDRPELGARFDKVVWGDLHQRLTTYIATRVRTGHLQPAGPPAGLARFTIDALIAATVSGPVAGPGAETTASVVGDDVLVQWVGAALRGSRNGLPLPAHPGQNPA